MNRVALHNGLMFHKDVKKLSVGSVDDFVDYLDVNPNTTAYSVVWCTDQWEVSKDYNISIPC